MSFFNNFSQGLSIGFQCMGYVLHYPTLLLFTALPTFFNAFFVVVAFNTLLRYTNVIDALRQAHGTNHIIQLHAQIPHSFWSLVYVFIITRIVSTIFTAALQYYIKDTLDNREPSMVLSLGNALSHSFSLILWGIVSLGARVLIGSLAGNRNNNGIPTAGTSLISSTLNAMLSLVTVFVIPFIIFSNQNVFNALSSSYDVVKNNFSKNMGALLSIAALKSAINSIIFILCLPAAAMIYYSIAHGGQLSDTAIYHYIMLALGIVVIPNLFAFPFKHAAQNIFAVVLYNYSQNKNTGRFGALFLQNP